MKTEKRLRPAIFGRHLVYLCLCIAFFFIPTFLAGCSSEKLDPTGWFQFRSLKEKQETEYKARHGDPKAARRMAEYCYFVEGSKAKAIHWYKIGASYGDKVAKDNVKQLSEE